MPERVYTDRYEILRHLAQGGMAEVYLALDQLLDRKVALKVLFAEYARDPAFVQRFRREAQAAANLNHPNIVAVFDWGEDAGTYFIVMEYVEGRSLRDAIHTEGPLYPNLAADLASDIAGALAFAHRNGVVHRDVKPGNILLTPQGQVKVTDFGIARAGASEGLTQTGSVMGTATYFSPEQAQGLPVDARSDVYSLGVVLYEMVCGVPPFVGDSPISVAYKHVREDPPPPAVANPDVPRELEDIILVALAKSPDERYASADDMRADLARFRRGEQPHAVPAAVVTAVPVSGTDATTVTPRTPPADRTRMGAAVAPTPPPPARRRSAWPFVLALVALLAVLAGLGYLLADQLNEGGTGTVVVDDFVGRTLDEATAIIESKGLEANPVYEINDDVPQGEVFAQDPPPQTRLDPGDTVELTVSQGRGQEPVPDVTGQSLEDAESRLEDAGFEVRTRTEASDTVPEGMVIRTDPPANQQVERGSTVTVYASTGVELVEVPDVTGMDEVTAASELGAADFRVQRVTEPSDTVAVDRVIRTEPAAGTQAAKGSTVQMVVSSGREQVTVPDVVGQTESSARAELTAAGFTVTVEYITDPLNAGEVVSQDPEAGSREAKGTAVRLIVGRVASSNNTTTSSTTTTTSAGGNGGGGGLLD